MIDLGRARDFDDERISMDGPRPTVPNWTTTGFQWWTGLGQRTEFDDDWISMEDRLGRRLRPQLMTRMTGFLWMTGCMKDWPTVGCASGTLVPMIQQVLVLFHYILHKHEFIYEFKGHEHSSLKS